MKTHVHKKISRYSVNLLPTGLQYFFAQQINGSSAIDLVVNGSYLEDTSIGPLGIPKNHGPNAASALLSYVRSGVIPWVEHFWNHDFDDYGLEFDGMKFYSAPHRADRYWDEHVINKWISGDKEQAMENLGRVVHLLADMGVPAHVHNDPHMGLLDYFDDDDFEDYVGETFKKGHLPEQWNVNLNRDKIAFNSSWDLTDYFKNFAETTQLYDSDDVDGFGTGQPFRWYSFLESTDPHRDELFDLTDYACNAIAMNLLPINYSFTAGLYLKFLYDIKFDPDKDTPPVKTEPVPHYLVDLKLYKITVHNDKDNWGSGEIFIKTKYGSSLKTYGQYNVDGGDSKNINIQLPNRIFKAGDTLTGDFEIYDDDTTTTESMGAVTLHEPETFWLSGIGEEFTFSRKSDNGACTLHFRIKLFEIPEEENRRYSEIENSLFEVSAYLKKIKIHDDEDWAADGEINIEVDFENHKKQFGTYSLGDGDSKDINELITSKILPGTEDINLKITVIDEDVTENESLGKIDLDIASTEWVDFNGSKTITKKSTNGDCTVTVEINVNKVEFSYEKENFQEFIEQTQLDSDSLKKAMFPIEVIEEIFPPLVFSGKRYTKLHHQHCHHVKRIKKGNKQKVYMFMEELPRRTEQLREDIRANNSLPHQNLLRKFENHRICKTCEKLQQKEKKY